MSAEDVVKLLKALKDVVPIECVMDITAAIEHLGTPGDERVAIDFAIDYIKEGIVCSVMYAVADGSVHPSTATYNLINMLNEIEKKSREIIEYVDFKKLEDLVMKLYFKLISIPGYDYYLTKQFRGIHELAEKRKRRESGE